MSDQFEITYQPISNRFISQPGTQHTRVVLSFEALSGLILTASQLIRVNQISIRRSMGETINLARFVQKNPHVLSYGNRTNIKQNWFIYMQSNFMIDPSRIASLYTCIIINPAQSGRDLLIQAQSEDFFQGAILLCKLFGLNWSSYIIEIHKGKERYPLITDFYLGKINFPGSGTINILLFYQQLNPQMASSLSKSLNECFGMIPKGIILPVNVVISSTDPNYNNIVSSAAVSPSLTNLPLKYHIEGSYYIFNVCTAEVYRKKGLGKSVLIALINDIISKGLTSTIQILVDPVNLSAYRLYVSLGFIKVDEIFVGGKRHHLLHAYV